MRSADQGGAGEAATLRTKARILIGMEVGSDGHPTGSDPRGMSQRELRTFGHEPMTPLAALRLRCLDCCGGSSYEVRSCVAVTCPAWPFRLGKSPWRTPLGEPEKARRRELLSRVGKIAGNSSKAEKSRRASAGLLPAAIAAPEDEAIVL
jgi:hypothetical protein